MEKKKTSTFSNGLIWFGAGVSIAEIMTGTYLAPLGFWKGTLAILLGHGIGCILLFLAGYMGAKTEKSSMETAAMSFGNKGNILFAGLNVLQLVGWTGIMIYDGALAANGLWDIGKTVWAIIIGGLIILWLVVGLTHLGKLNTVAMIALFVLTIVITVLSFRSLNAASAAGDAISFGAAVELSVAMPLSWFPLISDYTREAEKPFAATLVSSVTYGIVSTWMFLIGMVATIRLGTGDIAGIVLSAGRGIAGLATAGLIIVVLSTVTTTFLDAYSAGVSALSISKKIPSRMFAILVTGIGTLGAVFLPMDDITDFLYLIGSVFAPMIAVMLTDYYILKTDGNPRRGNRVEESDAAVTEGDGDGRRTSAEDVGGRRFDWLSFLCWLLGFALYRWLLHVDTPLGSTLPDMAVTMLLTVVIKKIAASLRASAR